MRQSAIMVAGAIAIGMGAVVLTGVRLNDGEIVSVLAKSDEGPGARQPELTQDTIAQELFRASAPLPGLGVSLFEIACPGPLTAVAGATLTCTGRTDDDRKVTISIRVVRVEQETLAWRYEIR